MDKDTNVGSAAGRRGATAGVRRSGARARWQDVASAQDGGGAATAAGRGPGARFALARRDSRDTDGWRDAFLAAGEAALTTKPATGEDLESDRLKARLGAALIERDLLEEKIAILEANRPLARRRLRP